MKNSPPFAPLKIPALTTTLTLAVLKSGVIGKAAPAVIEDGFAPAFRLGLIVTALLVIWQAFPILKGLKQEGKIRSFMGYGALLGVLGLQVSVVVAFISPLALIVSGLLWKEYIFALGGCFTLILGGAIFRRLWLNDLFPSAFPLTDDEESQDNLRQ